MGPEELAGSMNSLADKLRQINAQAASQALDDLNPDAPAP